jgi:hypothetical protein
MMKRTIATLAGALALVGGSALATETSGTATGTTGSATTTHEKEQSANELHGRIIRSSQTQLLLMNAEGKTVSVKIEPSTELVNITGDRPQELRANDDVRVEFVMKNKEKVATRVERTMGQGGSGLYEQFMPPSSAPSYSPSQESSDEDGSQGGVQGDTTNPQIDINQKPTY